MIKDVTSKGDTRFHPGKLKIKIMGREDTIDNFFMSALRNKAGEPCGFEGADHFNFCDCDFPLKYIESFYISLWLQRLASDKFITSEIVKYDGFYDGKEGSVNSHAKIFDMYKKGGIKGLNDACEDFLQAYGKARACTVPNKAGDEEKHDVQVVFPNWTDVYEKAVRAGHIIFQKEMARETCADFKLANFGFADSRKIDVYDRERLHNIIGAIVFATYDKDCGNATEGYVNQKIGDGLVEYKAMSERYSYEGN